MSCFYFYASHPFSHPNNVDDGKLERPEFESALVLLAYKSTKLLVTITTSMGFSKIHWAFINGRPCTCRHNVNWILRSISQSSTETHEPQSSSFSPSFIEDDTIDFMATTRPPRNKRIPSSSELAPIAQRLLQEKGANYHYQLHIERLHTLVL